MDGLADVALQISFKKTGVKALTINALYPFEDVKVLKENIEKLKDLTAEYQHHKHTFIQVGPVTIEHN